MPRSPIQLENQYSQLLQSMIKARQKNTSFQELQNKGQNKFAVFNQFTSKPNIKESHVQQRQFDVSPDRQITQGNQFHLRRSFNHRSKANQSEIVRGLSRPNSSTNSQQHFNTLTNNNAKVTNQANKQAVYNLKSLNKSEHYLSFQQNSKPLSTSMQSNKYESAQIQRNQSQDSNQDTQKKERYQGGIQLKKKLLNEILRGAQSNMSTRQLISSLKEKINQPKYSTNKTIDSTANEHQYKIRMMNSYILPTNSSSPSQIIQQHRPYISPYQQQSNGHSHSSYAQLLNQMRQSPQIQQQTTPQAQIQSLQRSMLKEHNGQEQQQLRELRSIDLQSNLGNQLSKINSSSPSEQNKYSHYSVLHNSFKQELVLMKCQDLSADNFMKFLFTLENKELYFNRQFFKNDLKDSMFGDLRVVAQTLIKRMGIDLSTCKSNLELKIKDNKQLAEINFKLNNNQGQQQKYHGKSQLKTEHLNELFSKNKQLTQIVQKQQALLKQSQEKEDLLTILLDKAKKNSELDIQETQKRAYEKNEGMEHIDSLQRKVSFIQPNLLSKDPSEKKYKNVSASSSSSLGSMNLNENPTQQSNLQEKGGLKLNLGSIKVDPSTGQQPIGYHEEFMARMNEFSESWRQAAMAEKRF